MNLVRGLQKVAILLHLRRSVVALERPTQSTFGRPRAHCTTNKLSNQSSSRSARVRSRFLHLEARFHRRVRIAMGTLLVRARAEPLRRLIQFAADLARCPLTATRRRPATPPSPAPLHCAALLLARTETAASSNLADKCVRRRCVHVRESSARKRDHFISCPPPVNLARGAAMAASWQPDKERRRRQH